MAALMIVLMQLSQGMPPLVAVPVACTETQTVVRIQLGPGQLSEVLIAGIERAPFFLDVGRIGTSDTSWNTRYADVVVQGLPTTEQLEKLELSVWSSLENIEDFAMRERDTDTAVTVFVDGPFLRLSRNPDAQYTDEEFQNEIRGWQADHTKTPYSMLLLRQTGQPAEALFLASSSFDREQEIALIEKRADFLDRKRQLWGR